MPKKVPRARAIDMTYRDTSTPLVTYRLVWSGTETGATPVLPYYASDEYESLDDAEIVYERVLGECLLIRADELGYVPTDLEMRIHAVQLNLVRVTVDYDGDAEIEVVKGSDYYWLVTKYRS